VEIVIDQRFNGPPTSANGGYTCGLLAAQVGEPAEIRLRAPPPLGRPLRFDGERLWDGETVVAEVRQAELELDAPPPVPFDEAEHASRSYPGFDEHAYPTCFVCGPVREDGAPALHRPCGRRRLRRAVDAARGLARARLGIARLPGSDRRGLGRPR